MNKTILQKDKEIKELKNYIDQIQNILALAPGNIYWKNKQGKFLGCNKNVARLFKFSSPKDIIGKTNYDLFDKIKADSLTKIDQQIMSTGEALSLEEKGENAITGKPAVYLSEKTPLFDSSNKIIGLIGTSLDITEKKKADEAKYKLEGMTLVAASVAHELRTPLRSIHSAATGIRKYLPVLTKSYEEATKANLIKPDIQPRHLQTLSQICEIIESEIDAAFTFINMLLVNIKTDINSKQDLGSFSIAQCVTEALQRYPFENDTNERAFIDWNSDVDFVFEGNKLLVTHVIFNLLKNSLYQIKAVGKGTLQIKAATNFSPGYNTLHFKDNAKGIAAAHLPHLFDHFFSQTSNGTGVGLAFCQATMKSLGGKITCQSKENEYAEFILHFPIGDNQK